MRDRFAPRIPRCRTLSLLTFAQSYLCIILVSTSALFGATGCHHSSHEEEDAGGGTPAALASAALTDEQGRALHFADFRAKTVVFNVFFASCPSACPRQTRALADVQQRLSSSLARRVRFVSLTIDPENDTPQVLKRFALDHGADLHGWSFVRASRSETTALTKELDVFAGSSLAQAAPAGHGTSVYLFDAGGRLRQRYAGSPLDVARLAREIEQLDSWFRDQAPEPVATRL